MRRIVLGGIAFVGALVAAAGLWAAEHPLAFVQRGWTAYAPLSSEPYPVLFRPPWWSLVMTVAGALAAGGALALLIAPLLLRRREASLSAEGGDGSARG